MFGVTDGKCNIPRTACGQCRKMPGQNGFPDVCPHGYTMEKLPILVGDLIEKLAKPVARLFGMKCLDVDGNLKPSSPCGRRKAKANRVVLR